MSVGWVSHCPFPRISFTCQYPSLLTWSPNSLSFSVMSSAHSVFHFFLWWYGTVTFIMCRYHFNFLLFTVTLTWAIFLVWYCLTLHNSRWRLLIKSLDWFCNIQFLMHAFIADRFRKPTHKSLISGIGYIFTHFFY